MQIFDLHGKFKKKVELLAINFFALTPPIPLDVDTKNNILAMFVKVHQVRFLCDYAAIAEGPDKRAKCHQILIDVKFSAAGFPKGADGTVWLDVTGATWKRTSKISFSNIRVRSVGATDAQEYPICWGETAANNEVSKMIGQAGVLVIKVTPDFFPIIAGWV